MARHLPGFALFRFVIRLPIKFPRSIKSTLSDACDFWLRISQERLLSGDKDFSSWIRKLFADGGKHAPIQAKIKLQHPFWTQGDS